MASPVKKLQESARSESKSSKGSLDIRHPLAAGKMDSADLRAFFKAFSCKGLIFLPAVLKAAQLMKFSKEQLGMIELALRLMTVREDNYASEEDIGYNFCSHTKQYEKKEPLFQMLAERDAIRAEGLLQFTGKYGVRMAEGEAREIVRPFGEGMDKPAFLRALEQAGFEKL